MDEVLGEFVKKRSWNERFSLNRNSTGCVCSGLFSVYRDNC